jgi:hypothetical protein
MVRAGIIIKYINHHFDELYLNYYDTEAIHLNITSSKERLRALKT